LNYLGRFYHQSKFKRSLKLAKQLPLSEGETSFCNLRIS
jgi:hypothetical protein